MLGSRLVAQARQRCTNATAANSSGLVPRGPAVVPSGTFRPTAVCLALPPPPPLNTGKRPPPAIGSAKQAMPPPPPIGSKKGLPPPPPLSRGTSPSQGTVASTAMSPATAAAWKSPAEVLTMMVEFVPTFYVPVNSVASTLDDDARDFVRSQRKIVQFFRKFRFYFDLRNVDSIRMEVKLREDVQHPRRGAADPKYTLSDIGEFASYTVLPEFVQSLENIDFSTDAVVNVRPVAPPPSIQVKLEERVPVLERLKEIVPKEEFEPVEDVEEKVPEDILFHPYFDCQGGLMSIATKHADDFQIVDGRIRHRPRHLAPLSLDDLDQKSTTEPELLQTVLDAVGTHEVAVWVSVTSLYEQLAVPDRRRIKRTFKSFASFLRSHGKILAVSNDLLKVSRWTPPSKTLEEDVAEPRAQKPVSQFTHMHILNELFERFPRGETLTLKEFMEVIPEGLRPSLPKNLVGWLAANRTYFTVEGADITPPNPDHVRIRRAAEHAPLDVAKALYRHIPEDGIAVKLLLERVPVRFRKHIEQVGIKSLVLNLSDWIELLDGDVFTRRTMEELDAAIASGKKPRRDAKSAAEAEAAAAEALVETAAAMLGEKPAAKLKQVLDDAPREDGDAPGSDSGSTGGESPPMDEKNVGLP